MGKSALASDDSNQTTTFHCVIKHFWKVIKALQFVCSERKTIFSDRKQFAPKRNYHDFPIKIPARSASLLCL